ITLLEWPDFGADGGQQTTGRRAHGQDGIEGSTADLRHHRSGAWKENDFCVYWRDRREFVEGRAIFWRRRAHHFDDLDAGRSPGTFHRFRTPGKAAGCARALLLKSTNLSCLRLSRVPVLPLLLLTGCRQEDFVIDRD